ncbi:MAG: glycine cleavage T C-terminal barrel domain-containing protein [Acidobacteriota bacterium]
MNSEFENTYNAVRGGSVGYFAQKRGLIAVHGNEAVQFLDGLISNDVKTLENGMSMLAAFPNAQGRLVALVRVVRHGETFLFDTEEATHEKVFNNLFRFTYAGDFFVEDISDNFRFVSVFGKGFLPSTQPFIEFEAPAGHDYFIDSNDADDFFTELRNIDAVAVTDDVYETLRIESGIPKYGVDMDETTIVPELGIDGLISYNKGCYIGQEIIARIHFRGHIAKQLTGLLLSEPQAIATGSPAGQDLKSPDGKNAGRITSTTFSPRLGRIIALAFVRYEYLAEETALIAAGETCTVKNLPFI